MEKDIFCKIIEGEVESDYLFETEDIIAIADIAPKAPVHYLVIPKKHIATVQDAEKEDIELMGKIIMGGKRVAEEKNIEDGYKLIFNVGKKGGQEVPHIHLHILGGWDNNK